MVGDFIVNKFGFESINNTDIFLQYHEPLVRQGQGVCRGERVARSKLPEKGDVHSPISGRVSYVDNFRVSIVGGEHRVVDPVDFSGLEPSQLEPLFRTLGCDLPGSTGISSVLVNSIDADPDVRTREVLLATAGDILESGIQAMELIYAPRKKILAVPRGSSASLFGLERMEIDTTFPACLDPLVERAVVKKQGLEDAVTLGIELLYQLGQVFRTGLPVLDSMISINGEVAVVPVGMPVAAIVENGGEPILSRDKIVLGGLRTGVTLATPVQGVDRSVAAITIVRDFSCSPLGAQCRKCGECARRCPAGIDPAKVLFHIQNGMNDRLDKESILSCFECGLCEYVCASNRPLLRHLRRAKHYFYDRLR